MNIFSGLFAPKRPPLPESDHSNAAVSIITAQPIVITQTDDEKLKQQKYRIGAIMRYVQQCAEEKVEISAAKMKEFDLEFNRLRAEIAQAEHAKGSK